ncbi:MAG: NAD(P)H-quinone oxidoreductase subunit L [Cyanobacteriota bacterium]|nr:NAD(P)H-quinone oxidoreductase subunit L [Cyanobacteriota bacterium]
MPPPIHLRFPSHRIPAVALPGFLSQLSTETLLVLGAYVAIGGLYLVVIPLVLLWWLKTRWTVMGKIERTAIYGLVFLFFPGLILFAPFLNLRMAGQGEVGG